VKRAGIATALGTWAVILTTDVLGAIILFRLAKLLPVVYFAFLFWMEYKILKYSCVQCYYCGKTCGMGKDRLAHWLFGKGRLSEAERRMTTWRDWVMEVMAFVIPMAAGIVQLVRHFTWPMEILVLSFATLFAASNLFLYGGIVCRHRSRRYCRAAGRDGAEDSGQEQ
jgi:hypothetical protein